MGQLTLAGLLLAAFALGAVIVLAAWAMRDAKGEADQRAKIIADLEKQNQDQAVKIAELETIVKGKAHTYATAAGLEDALAIQFDVAFHATEALQYVQARSAQMNEVLGILRQSPHTYNPDRPAGQRPQPEP